MAAIKKAVGTHCTHGLEIQFTQMFYGQQAQYDKAEPAGPSAVR